MSVGMATWVRIKPAGDVHYVVGINSFGWRMFACGMPQHRDVLTDDYPPDACRCVECEDLTAEEAE